MKALLLTDTRMVRHQPGEGHPESPSRLATILEKLEREPVAGARVASPRKATEAELERVHNNFHVQHVLSLAGRAARLDEDTALSPDSVEAALLAAGAAVQGTQAVLDGDVTSAFALVRPPGHHAEAMRAMGFCVFNNIALAAAEAHARGTERVLCVDWDVHHGNGTQHSFESRRDLLFMSAHQFPFYPGTGDVDEVGRGEGAGFTVNVPMPDGCGDGDYAAVFEQLLIPIANAYAPQLVLVSAGFDAHQDDPLGGMKVSTEGYAALCGAVKAVADAHCGGKMVLALEGGYNVGALADSVHACVQVLCGRTPPPLQARPSASVTTLIKRVIAAHKPYWQEVL